MVKQIQEEEKSSILPASAHHRLHGLHTASTVTLLGSMASVDVASVHGVEQRHHHHHILTSSEEASMSMAVERSTIHPEGGAAGGDAAARNPSRGGGLRVGVLGRERRIWAEGRTWRSVASTGAC